MPVRARVAPRMVPRGGGGYESDSDEEDAWGSHAWGSRTRVNWSLRRLLYGFDSAASSPAWQTLGLLALAVVLVSAGGRAVMGTGNNLHSNYDHDTSLSEGIWLSWSLFVDPASLPEAQGAPAPRHCLPARVVASLIVIIGVGYFAVFLALVVDAVQEKLDALKKGLSPVVERGHTVILGWTDETSTIVRELCLANESLGGGCIAILGERGKRQMEAELAALLKAHELRGSRVVFRAGSRLCASHLRKVATETARSVLVVSDARLSPDAADAEVLQVVLNLSTLRLRHTNVVAEVRVSDNEALLQLVSQGTVAAVSSHDLVGALMLQFARQPGLAGVYSQVLGFEGSEFYVKHWPELEGRAFGTLPQLLPAAVPLGVLTAAGKCVLNPPADSILAPGDALVVLAEDDDSYWPVILDAAAPPMLPPTAPCFVPPSEKSPLPERVLLAGWRRDVPSMLLLLDRLVAPGSELHIMSTLPLAEREKQIAEAGVALDALLNLTLVHHVANSAVRRHLEALPLNRYTSMIIAADASAEVDVIRSDSQCLATLLLVRGIQAARRRRLEGSPSYASFAAIAAAAMVDGVGADEALQPRLSESAAKAAAATVDSAYGDMPLTPPEYDPGASMHGSVFGGSQFGGASTQAATGRRTAFGFAGDVISSAADLPIVVEILDPRTQRTVADSSVVGLSMVSDFMQSNELVSKILAMVSEDNTIKKLLDQLLGGTGTQFAVAPSEQYVLPDAAVSFAELAQHCLHMRKCILCGYIEPGVRRRKGVSTPAECVMNPENKTKRRQWAGCGLVLIATDARLLAPGRPSCLSRGWIDPPA